MIFQSGVFLSRVCGVFPSLTSNESVQGKFSQVLRLVVMLRMLLGSTAAEIPGTNCQLWTFYQIGIKQKQTNMSRESRYLMFGLTQV